MEKTYFLKPSNGQKSFNNKAVVIENGNKKELYSYNSLVCSIVGDSYTLNKAIKKDLLLSATTLKHIKAFLLNELNIEPTKAELVRGL